MEGYTLTDLYSRVARGGCRNGRQRERFENVHRVRDHLLYSRGVDELSIFLL